MAENELSLQQRLADTVLASIDDLQEIAEEMFTRFCAASGTAAAEREKTRVLMQEIQRLEEENGRLRTELDKAEERCRVAARETESAMKLVEGYQANNRALDARNTELETQIRQMVAKEAKDGNPSVSLEADSSRCTREPLGAAACPKCGSMDSSVLPKNQRICCVCGEVFEDG